MCGEVRTTEKLFCSPSLLTQSFSTSLSMCVYLCVSAFVRRYKSCLHTLCIFNLLQTAMAALFYALLQHIYTETYIQTYGYGYTSMYMCVSFQSKHLPFGEGVASQRQFSQTFLEVVALCCLAVAINNVASAHTHTCLINMSLPVSLPTFPPSLAYLRSLGAL